MSELPTDSPPSSTNQRSAEEGAAAPSSEVPFVHESFFGSPQLLNYLNDYAIVNSAWSGLTSGYTSLKSYNDYLKYGMEFAENTTARVYASTQPYLKQLDERYAISSRVDAAGVQTLKKVEEGAATVKAKVEEGAQKMKGAVEGVVEGTKEKGNQVLVSANRPINHLLDVTELLVDKILPPTVSLAQGENSEDDSASSSPLGAADEEEDKKLASNPLPRAAALSRDVGGRVKFAALAQLDKLTLRSPTEVLEMTHLVDLIQYAATHIDAQGKANQARQIVTGAAETVSVVGKEVKEKTKQRLSSLGNLVDDTTKDLKEQSVKATVAVVATIAQASEIVRRRLVSGASSLSVEETKIAMENRLKEILGQTTSYANSLTPEKLRDYVSMANERSAAVLAHLLKLVNISSSEDLRSSNMFSWTWWTASIRERISPLLPATEELPGVIPEEVEQKNVVEELNSTEEDAAPSESENDA